MTVDNHDIDKLKINLLTIDQYNQQQQKSQDELYVVNETLDIDDPANIISSKTYADKGREAVVTQTTEPTSQYTQIWIDPDEAVVYITPASADMDNITETGSENLLGALSPDFSRATGYSQAAGSSFELISTGWLCAFVGASSSIDLKQNSSSGVSLMDITTPSGTKTSENIFLEKGTTVYVNSRSGTVTLTFYPCKGLSS